MSEFDWIARHFAPLATGRGAAGLSDDVAELSGQADIITVDALVEGIHFLSDDPIDTVACKLVRVNVSDVIAKGCLPDEAVLTLGWPKERSEEELASFAAALGDELEKWGVCLIGGDTVTSPEGVFLSLTLTGRLLDGGAIVRRSGAQAGDMVWLSGPIGWGGLGLQDALAGKDSRAREVYRVPEIPRLELAELISKHASASMDVSDGLLGDLEKLCVASGVGANVELETVELCADAPKKDDLETVLTLCTAGDDYQVLFTAPAEARGAISSAMPRLYPIGRIEQATGLKLYWRGTPVKLPENTGFTH